MPLLVAVAFALALNWARFGDWSEFGYRYLTVRWHDRIAGTWVIVDAWGDLSGMNGRGKLVGVPIEGENGITDYYVGTITL